MITLRIFLNNLLGLYLIISEDRNGFCLTSVWQPPSPNITLQPGVGGKQTLTVSWLVIYDFVGDMSEIQISRADRTYSENVSVLSSNSDEHTWSWASDLPLECVDHSVRIRHFYNQSVVSRWSNWTTNPGIKARNGLMIFPFQGVLREGTNATFCCIPPPGVNVTSMAVSFEERPLISLGARVKAIAIDDLKMLQRNSQIFRGFYPLTISCSGTADYSRDIWNYVAPPPQKPRNFSCMTSDMVTVNCTWDPGRNPQQSGVNPQTQTLHIENSDQAPINCQHAYCTFPAIPKMEQYKISVVVKNKVGEVTESHSFNISDRVFPVVQWDSVSPGVTYASVSWTVQGNLTQLNILCQVTTNPQGTSELSCNSMTGRCKVQLQHLIPNTRYSTRVRCSVSGRLWGMWTHPFSFTTCPLVTVNLWRRVKQQSNPHSRHITLLWTPHVPGSATKVVIQSYIIQWSQGGQNRTETKNGGQNHTEVSIGPERCDFTVQAVLREGLSIPAHIAIPKADDGEKPLVEKRLSSSSAAGGFNLSWPEQVSATCGYTVEWCILGSTNLGSLQWIKMRERNNALFLPADNFEAGRRYTFNIYGCTENGYILLEVQTGYSQELRSVPPPDVVKQIQKTSSSVTLEWCYNEADPEHPAFITGYLVIVQDTLPLHAAKEEASRFRAAAVSGPELLVRQSPDLNLWNDFNGTVDIRRPEILAELKPLYVFNVSVEDPQRKSVTIGGLQENHEYAFSLCALTKNGPGPPANVTTRTRTNHTAPLTKMLTPIFLLLGCVILLCSQRKLLKKGLMEIFTYPAGMNIRTTELVAFLNKAGETVLSHKLEECISCDIEILNTCPPPLNETTTLRDPDPIVKPSPPGFQSFTSPSSLFSVSFQAEYRPQSATLLCDGTVAQQTTSIINQSYFHPMVEDEPRQVMSEIKSSFEPEFLQESCSVIYGYISKDT